MSKTPAGTLGTLGSCASSTPAPHRVQELNLEEKQWHLDQELRGYLNQEGRWDVGRRGHLGLVSTQPQYLRY